MLLVINTDPTDGCSGASGNLSGRFVVGVFRKPDHYEVLGVARNATTDEIKTAFFHRCRAVTFASFFSYFALFSVLTLD